MADIVELRRRADEGDAEAAFRYGVFLLRGEFLVRRPVNIIQAESYICRAKNNGSIDAAEFWALYNKE